MAQTRIKKEIIPKDIQDASKNLLNNNANIKVNEVVSNPTTKYLDRMKSGNTGSSLNQTSMNYAPVTSILTNTDTDNYIKEAYAENPEYWGANLNQLRREAINRAYGDIQRIKSGQPTKAQAKLQEEEQARLLQENQQMAGQVGMQPAGTENMLSPTGEVLGKATPLDYGQALTAGIRGTIPSVIGKGLAGAAGGAVGGSVIPGLGTVAGAVIGGVGGIITGVLQGLFSNLKSQRTGNIQAQRSVLTSGQSNLKKAIMIVKSTEDVKQRADAISAFNAQMQNIEKAYSQLKIDTQKDVYKFDDATEDLQAFENFYFPGGAKEYYTQAMKLALVNGLDDNALNELMWEDYNANQ